MDISIEIAVLSTFYSSKKATNLLQYVFLKPALATNERKSCGDICDKKSKIPKMAGDLLSVDTRPLTGHAMKFLNENLDHLSNENSKWNRKR